MELQELKLGKNENLDLSKNIFIEASAGTGKTYTIKEIVARLLKKGESLRNILIVTYTVKATEELRERIRKQIEDELKEDKITSQEKKYFEEALREIDSAPIFTIHSFCQKSLRDHAYEAGQSFVVNKVDDGDLLEEFIQKKIRDEWCTDSEILTLMELSKSSNKLQEKLLKYFKSGIINYFDGVKVDKFENFASYIVEDTKEKLAKKNIDLDNPEVCNKFLALKDYDDFDVAFNNTKGVKTIVKNLIKKIPEYHLAKFVLSRIAKTANEWKSYKKEHNLQSFNDMIDSVRDNLKNESFKKALQNEYKYAIIDEFQDTNQRQWDIFKSIFLNSKQHRIIVVGDPKQSIYSFQGADVNVYTKAILEIYENGLGYKLPTNYRSTSKMIETCNTLFGNDVDAFKFGKNITFTDSNSPDSSKIEPTFDGITIPPFLISEEMKKNEFAEIAAKKIIEFTTINKDGKTRLQVFDKENPRELRNVYFNDFAILARTRSELPYIEYYLKKYGIPHLRYNDKNLFGGRECLEWIALFAALNANDFTGSNIRFLNEVLTTDFFGVDFKDVDNLIYQKGDSKERTLLQEWKIKISQREFAKFLESVFEKSKIINNLNGVENLQEFSKIKQIGDYAVDYLYNNHASLDSLILHLQDLLKNEANTEDENGNIVAKASDFKAVQIMTIHASKGLEFPVVISVAGFKGLNKNQNSDSAVLYHKKSELNIGVNESAKDTRENEEVEEWERLFYVNYTRASSVLILPRYVKIDAKGTKIYFAKKLDFLKTAFVDSKVKLKNCGDLKIESHSDKEWKNLVAEIIAKTKENSADNTTKKEQEKIISKVHKKVPFAVQKMHSYSSLTHGDNEKNEDSFTENNRPILGLNGKIIFSKNTIDNSPIIFENEFDNTENVKVVADYPRGVSIGNVIHNTLESLCNSEEDLTFETFNNNLADLNLILTNEKLKNLIASKFRNEGLFNKDSKIMNRWIEDTICMLWHTLNGKLKNAEGDIFKLSEIKKGEALAEMEYYLNADDEKNNESFNAFCKGFMDLVFKKDGKYYILDWKSDFLEKYDAESVKSQIDDHYAIQRVLYSYCLIQWLKSFTQKNEQEIFKNDFGGIYYVLVRGCKENSFNGIYGQTWKNFEELDNCFLNIKNLISAKV